MTAAGASQATPTEIVDLVVVTYNSADMIGDLLDSVAAATGRHRTRIVVVDNASTDDTAAVVEQRGDCLLLRAANRGYAAGLNAGVHALAGDGPILFCNPDVRLETGSIERLVDQLSRSDVGVVVPRLVDEDGQVARSLRREPTVARTLGAGDSRVALLSEIVNDPRAYNEEQDVDWATGAVMVVSRQCYRDLDGLDESFFMYSEETDFCLRAQDLGYLVRYTPRATAMHVGGGSGRNPQLYAMQVLNRIRLHRRRHPAPATLTLLILTLLREAVLAARGRDESRCALVALLLRSRRPGQLGWSSALLAGNQAHQA